MELVILSRCYGKHVVYYDDQDHVLVSQYTWWVSKRGNIFYAATDVKGKRVEMHKLFLLGEVVDHKNRNGLDNRRENLRIASKSQNGANRGTPRKKSEITFKGVRKARGKRKGWDAYISYDHKCRYLGYFKTEIDAAQAYNAAALERYGEFACLNSIPLVK